MINAPVTVTDKTVTAVVSAGGIVTANVTGGQSIITIDIQQGAQGLPGESVVMAEHSISYGDPSPITIYTTTIRKIFEVVLEITESFNGVLPTISLGIDGTPERYLAVDQNDPTEIGRYQVAPDIGEHEAGVDIQLFVDPGEGATAGKGIITIRA